MILFTMTIYSRFISAAIVVINKLHFVSMEFLRQLLVVLMQLYVVTRSDSHYTSWQLERGNLPLEDYRVLTN